MGLLLLPLSKLIRHIYLHNPASSNIEGIILANPAVLAKPTPTDDPLDALNDDYWDDMEADNDVFLNLQNIEDIEVSTD